MGLEEYKKEVNKNITSLFNKANEEEKKLLNTMVNVINDLSDEKQELIDYLKEQINECPITKNDEADMFYIGKMRAYQEILSKIEKSDK